MFRETGARYPIMIGCYDAENIENYTDTLWHANMTVKDSKLLFQFSHTFVENILRAY